MSRVLSVDITTRIQARISVSVLVSLLVFICSPVDALAENDREQDMFERSLSEAERQQVLDEMDSAWQRRSQKHDRLRMSWSTEWAYNEYALSLMNPNLPNAELMELLQDQQKAARLKNAEPIRYTLHYSMLLDGRNVRYRRSGKVLSSADAPPELIDNVSTTNGEISSRLSTRSPTLTHKNGFVFDHATSAAAMEVTTVPVRAFYAPTEDFASGIPSLDDLKNAAVYDCNQGDGGVVFTRERADTKRQISYLFAPDLDYNLVMIQTHVYPNSGRGDSLLHIEYAQDVTTALWYPSSWRYTSYFPQGDIRLTADAHTVDVEFNPETESSDFLIDFPAGTMVSDSRPGSSGYNGRFGDSVYIVMPDGTKRTVGDEERFLSYEELLRRNRQLDNRANAWRRLSWIIFGNLLAVLLFGTAFSLWTWLQKTQERRGTAF